MALVKTSSKQMSCVQYIVYTVIFRKRTLLMSI